MKLGIYGDSFAAAPTNRRSWITPLLVYDTQIYADDGVSVDYTLKTFVETHEMFDKVIVCLTEPSRVYIPNHPNFNHMYLDEIYIKNKTSKIPYSEQKKILDYFRFHVQYVQSREVEKHKFSAVYHYIKALRKKDCLILPCFNKEEKNMHMPLMDISRIDLINKDYGKKLRDCCDNYGDPRQCHLSPINNFILGSKIKKWIRTSKFRHNIKDYQTTLTYEELLFNDLRDHVHTTQSTHSVKP